MPTRHETLLFNARRRVARERQWIEDHGGSRAGYINRYGSVLDEVHYGDGGEAIFAADKAELDKAVDWLNKLLAKGAGK